MDEWTQERGGREGASEEREEDEGRRKGDKDLGRDRYRCWVRVRSGLGGSLDPLLSLV